MRTHIVGTRKPVSLGFCAPVTKPVAPVQVAPAHTQFAVVSKGFALHMQGYKATRSKSGKGTMYALYSSYSAAWLHINTHKMRLYATVVSW